MKENKEIPLEACVKYLVRERDELKRKLDLLVPYTKKLESEKKSLEKLVSETMSDKDKTIARLEKENIRLVEEKTMLISDYQSSEWYKGLLRGHNRKDELIKRLKSERDEAYRKLNTH